MLPVADDARAATAVYFHKKPNPSIADSSTGCGLPTKRLLNNIEAVLERT